MAPSLSDYIFDKSFQKVGYKLLIRNETSQTIFNRPEYVFIRELRVDGFVLEIPFNICQKGHTLTLFFLNLENTNKFAIPMSGQFKEAFFEVMAKVEKLEPNKFNQETVFIEVHFSQYDLSAWKKILLAYSVNQDKINDLQKKQHLNRDDNE